MTGERVSCVLRALFGTWCALCLRILSLPPPHSLPSTLVPTATGEAGWTLAMSRVRLIIKSGMTMTEVDGRRESPQEWRPPCQPRPAMPFLGCEEGRRGRDVTPRQRGGNHAHPRTARRGSRRWGGSERSHGWRESTGNAHQSLSSWRAM